MRPIEYRPVRERRKVRRRTRGLVTLTLIAALVVALVGVLNNGPPHRAETAARVKVAPARGPARLRSHRLAVVLPSPLQDAATVSLPGGSLLLFGGLDASDTSTTAVMALAHDHLWILGRLPLAQHDAQAAILAGRAYIFGGGEVSSYDHILRFDPASGKVSVVGALSRSAISTGPGSAPGFEAGLSCMFGAERGPVADEARADAANRPVRLFSTCTSARLAPDGAPWSS